MLSMRYENCRQHFCTTRQQVKMSSRKDDELQQKININLQKLRKRRIQPKVPTKAQNNKLKNQWQLLRLKMLQMQFLKHARQKKRREQVRHHLSTDALKRIIDILMVLQQRIIVLGETLNRNTRVQLLLIFFSAALRIIFNAYRGSVFMFKYILGLNTKWTFLGGFLFYGHHLFTSAVEVLLTILCFSKVYDSISETARLVNELNLYVADDVLRGRLSQFVTLINTNLRKYTIFGLYNLDASFVSTIAATTSTYIIILMQYGLENELEVELERQNMTFIGDD